MAKEIILTEEILNKCFCCGGVMPKDSKMYDYYCCKECEVKDNKRITNMINANIHPIEIMNGALENVMPQIKG